MGFSQRRPWFPVVLLLMCIAASACQSKASSAITILDGDQVHTVTTAERVPAALLSAAGVSLSPSDRLFINGRPADPNAPLASTQAITLQIRRATQVMVNGQALQTSALTLGEALAGAGVRLYAADHLEPSAGAPVLVGMTANYVPARELFIFADGKQVPARSAAATVGGALAEAGMPLLGLDTSSPSEGEAAPQDGQIRIVRVAESLVLAQKSIPYKSQYQQSDTVELDHQEVLQAGQAGLSVSRVRIRYEDGEEVARRSETETVVRPPRDRIVGFGTKVLVHSAVVDGVPIQYWRAVQMFATAYSPCNSAADRCYPGTASGLPVKKGVVAVIYRWYQVMQGQAVYIPGYGRATIEDVGGGIPGKLWIDLGYTDAEFAAAGDQWGKYVTVYFLAPPPPNILFVLE